MKKLLLLTLLGCLMTAGLQAAPLLQCADAVVRVSDVLTQGFSCQSQDKIFSNFATPGGVTAIPGNWVVSITYDAFPDGSDEHRIQVARNQGTPAAMTGTYGLSYTVTVDPLAWLQYITSVVVSADVTVTNGSYQVVKTVTPLGLGALPNIGVGSPSSAFPSFVYLDPTKSIAVSEVITLSNARLNSFTDYVFQTAVPEPGVIGLVGFGLIGLGLLSGRRRAKK